MPTWDTSIVGSGLTWNSTISTPEKASYNSVFHELLKVTLHFLDCSFYLPRHIKPHIHIIIIIIIISTCVSRHTEMHLHMSYCEPVSILRLDHLSSYTVNRLNYWSLGGKKQSICFSVHAGYWCWSLLTSTCGHSDVQCYHFHKIGSHCPRDVWWASGKKFPSNSQALHSEVIL